VNGSMPTSRGPLFFTLIAIQSGRTDFGAAAQQLIGVRARGRPLPGRGVIYQRSCQSLAMIALRNQCRIAQGSREAAVIAEMPEPT
jgi:hypothetical protein